MARISRNAPCPCGSGRKHKLCCGETRAQEQARADALTEIAGMPSWFPALRPSSPAFEAWAVGRCGCATTEEIEEGMGLISADEAADLVARARAELPPVWQRAGAQDDAERVLLAGAVAAALSERCDRPQLGLTLLEEGLDADAPPAELLALALNATDLWSIREARIVDDALAALDEDLEDEAYARAWDAAVEHEATRLLTDAHRDRLGLLVGRLDARLPSLMLPTARERLLIACATFRRDPAVREELAVWLLGDAACMASRLDVPLAA